MAFDVNKPADTQTIAQGPGDIRENFRALKDDKIVNAEKLMDLSPGNASGNIPVSNGNLCVNLNAEKLGGNLASAFALAGHTHPVATTSSNGLMSNTDKAKLGGIAAGAEVNQNAFGKVLVGSTTIAADAKIDTLELVAGTNIVLTPDATNDKVTIALTGKVASAAYADSAGSASTANSATTAGSCTGNAATATKLQTARKINGVNFDGSADITIAAAANGGNADTIDGYHASDFILASTAVGSQVSVIAGTVNHGGTVPLPPGYTEEQCAWFVSPNTRTVDDDDTIQCYTSAAVLQPNTKGRVVTNWTGQRGGQLANYICIGVK